MSRPTNCSHRLHGVDCVEWCEESFGAAARCYANAEAAELLIPFMVADVRLRVLVLVLVEEMLLVALTAAAFVTWTKVNNARIRATRARHSNRYEHEYDALIL